MADFDFGELITYAQKRQSRKIEEKGISVIGKVNEFIKKGDSVKKGLFRQARQHYYDAFIILVENINHFSATDAIFIGNNIVFKIVKVAPKNNIVLSEIDKFVTKVSAMLKKYKRKEPREDTYLPITHDMFNSHIMLKKTLFN